VIEHDSVPFRALVQFLRIRCIPPELCPGPGSDQLPEQLASALAAATCAVDGGDEAFKNVIDYYFLGEAATHVLRP
jgi:hypothetical protein